jgi:hypothetical protein
MAEVGQSILKEHNVGIVRFMQAKELRRLQGYKTGREPATRSIREFIENAAFLVGWA